VEVLKSKDPIDHNIERLNLIKVKLLCLFKQKNGEVVIVCLKRTDKLDMLHAKIIL
jgi:hypothetical protein